MLNIISLTAGFVWIFRGSLHPLSTSPLLFLFTFVYGYLRKPISINALVSDLSMVKMDVSCNPFTDCSVKFQV